jgi:hypothetical protein
VPRDATNRAGEKNLLRFSPAARPSFPDLVRQPATRIKFNADMPSLIAEATASPEFWFPLSIAVSKSCWLFRATRVPTVANFRGFRAVARWRARSPVTPRPLSSSHRPDASFRPDFVRLAKVHRSLNC